VSKSGAVERSAPGDPAIGIEVLEDHCGKEVEPRPTAVMDRDSEGGRVGREMGIPPPESLELAPVPAARQVGRTLRITRACVAATAGLCADSVRTV